MWPMDNIVFVSVLCAAFMHAGWNALVKAGSDRLMSITVISVWSALISLPLLLMVPVPPAAAWPWLVASVAFHTVYKLLLARAYRLGDMGQVYPIARGSAPLLTALLMTYAFNEILTPVAAIGILLLVIGVWLMSVRGGSDSATIQTKAIAYALATAVLIALYTITDGQGARLGASALSYVIWLFVFDGLAMLIATGWIRGGANVAKALVSSRRTGAFGALMSMGSYGIALWAMRQAPIASVAALRETSVLFAAMISFVVLKESLNPWRIASGLLIVSGVVLTRLVM